MKFLLNHYWITLFSFVVFAVLFQFRDKLTLVNAHLLEKGNRSKVILTLAAAFVVFHVFAYLTKSTYYIPYFGGIIGDHYMYARYGMHSGSYYNPQHAYHPFIPAHLFRLVANLGYSSPAAPDYLEKAFVFFSIPNRIMALFGAFVAFLIFRFMGISKFESTLGAWFLGVSFAFWFWPLQSNALGFLMPLSLMALYAVMKALKSRQNSRFVLAAFVVSMCVFTHISAAHFAVSLGVVVGFVCVARFVKEKSRAPLVNLACFGMTAVAFVSILYGLMSKYYAERNVIGIGPMMDRMVDTNMFGHFSIGLDFIKRYIQDGISTNLSMIVGLIQSGEKSNVELAVIVVILVSLFLLVISIKNISFKEIAKYESNLGLLVVAGSFFLTLIGFSVRKTWPQYYSAIVPTAAVFIAALCFYPKRKPGSFNYGALFFIPLILSMFYINGFSSTRVFNGAHLNDDEGYVTLSAIQDKVGNSPVLYFGPRIVDDYNYGSIQAYYCLNNKFCNIDWRRPVPFDSIRQEVANFNGLVLLSQKDYPEFQAYTASNNSFRIGPGIVRIVGTEEAGDLKFYTLRAYTSYGALAMADPIQ